LPIRRADSVFDLFGLKSVGAIEQKIDFFVRTALPTVEGTFYDGNMLESFGFVNGSIHSAKKCVVLIDNSK